MLFIFVGVSGLLYLEIMLICVKFNELIVDLVEKMCIFVENVLKDVDLLVSDLDVVILNGGLIWILVV